MEMDLEYRDLVDAIKEGTAKPESDEESLGAMMPIKPFRAEDTEGAEMEVVGVIAVDDHHLEFVAIKVDQEDGSFYPSREGNVWPLKSKH